MVQCAHLEKWSSSSMGLGWHLSHMIHGVRHLIQPCSSHHQPAIPLLIPLIPSLTILQWWLKPIWYTIYNGYIYIYILYIYIYKSLSNPYEIPWNSYKSHLPNHQPAVNNPALFQAPTARQHLSEGTRPGKRLQFANLKMVIYSGIIH